MGDPGYANVAYSYKDYSNLRCHTGKSCKDEFRIEATIATKRNACDKSEWKGQGFGIWGASGAGWFSEAMILKCIENGRARGVTPVLSRNQFLEVAARRDGNNGKHGNDGNNGVSL